MLAHHIAGMRSVNPLDYRMGTSPDGAIRPQSELPIDVGTLRGRQVETGGMCAG